VSKTITEVKVVNYRVKDDADVFAVAVIGEAQEGAWTMRLGDIFLDGGVAPKKVKVKVGNGKTLADEGAHLEVSATVKDVRPETDRLSLAVQLTGGDAKESPEISNEGNPGDNASYSVIVRFI
jgi:hypothetical protein